MGNTINTLNEIIKRIADVLRSGRNVTRFSQATIASLAIYLVLSRVHEAFLGPLSSIPGPLKLKLLSLRVAGGLDNTPGMKSLKSMPYQWKMFLTYHELYGQVVRLGPRYIVISDKDMLRQVLQKDDLPKGPTYTSLQKLVGNNMFSSTDTGFHKQRRRTISPAFSGKYLHSLEPYMLKTTEALFRRIDRDIERTRNADGCGVVDIWTLLQYLALDIIGETAFGRTFNMLEGNDHFIPRFINKSLEAANYFTSNPVRGAIALLLNSGGLFTGNFKLVQYMKDLILERLEGGQDARRNDILQILIDSQSANEVNDRLTSKAICSETELFLVAGSETTSNTIGFAIIELLKNPAALVALREEIDAVPMDEGQKLIHHGQLKNLPYLNAVINETLRLDSVSAVGVERYADRDLVLGDGIFVPRGTVIHCNTYHAHLNAKYWPDPKAFRPERWLDGSKSPADISAFFPFSIGSRNCIGKAFAQQEMRLSIANLIKQYDLRAIPKDLADSDDRLAFITLTIKSNSFKVEIKRREVTQSVIL